MKNQICSSSNMSLCDIETGKKVQVVKIVGQNTLKRRVLDMGLVPGTMVSVERKAPFNDPVSVWFRGYELSLRQNEAEAVLVKPLGCSGCTACGRGR